MSFGKMPMANGFLELQEFNKEFFYELEVGFSEDNFLFQVNDHPKSNKIFNDKYPFYTHKSNYMVSHFKDYFNWIKKKFIKTNSPSGFIYEKLLEEYNVGIITAIFRKNILKDLTKIFDERFSIIGDFDFFLKLSKLHYFHFISTPLAFYRIHDKNFSSIFKEKEMAEFNIWAQDNKNNISSAKLTKMKNKISIRQLLHFKFSKDYTSCYKILFENYKSFLIIKMLIIVFTPLYILKKISWFHT